MEVELTVHVIDEDEMPVEQRRALDQIRRVIAEGVESE